MTLAHEYDVIPTPQQASQELAMSDPSVFDQVGRAGMWMDRFTSQGGVGPVKWNFEWGMAPLPSDVRSATGIWGWGYVISSEAHNPDACWKWISFLSGTVSNRLIPARMSLAASSEYQYLVGGEAAFIAQTALENGVMVSDAALDGFGEEMTVLGDAFDVIVRGEASPEKALSAAQRRVEN